MVAWQPMTACRSRRVLPYGELKNGFMSPLGLPCHGPPYGTISTVDLKSRTFFWQMHAGTLEGTGLHCMKTELQIPIVIPTPGRPMAT